jgi:hypothetical protein
MVRSGIWIFAVMCVIWGIPYLLIRVAVGEISPVMLVFARTAIGTHHLDADRDCARRPARSPR